MYRILMCNGLEAHDYIGSPPALNFNQATFPVAPPPLAHPTPEASFPAATAGDFSDSEEEERWDGRRSFVGGKR